LYPCRHFPAAPLAVNEAKWSADLHIHTVSERLQDEFSEEATCLLG
jgi:hypothetical protein